MMRRAVPRRSNKKSARPLGRASHIKIDPDQVVAGVLGKLTQTSLPNGDSNNFLRDGSRAVMRATLLSVCIAYRFG